MASPKTTKTTTASSRNEREYTVVLTPKGEAFVSEQRALAKLAVAAEMLRLAGDPLAEQVRYEREARASGAGWRDAWRSYANLGGNDADRGW